MAGPNVAVQDDPAIIPGSGDMSVYPDVSASTADIETFAPDAKPAPAAGFNPTPNTFNIPSAVAPGPAFARGGGYESPDYPWREPSSSGMPAWMKTQPDIGAITKEAERIQGLKTQADEISNAQHLKKLQADTKLQEGYFNAEAFAAGDMPKPWNADKEAEKRFTGPFEKFGNIGVIFAGIASAFSRQPMTAALNATAAAMNSIHDSDVEGYKRAYTAWKDNTELAVKRFNIQHTLFNDTQHLFNSDLTLWKAENEANAAKFKDMQMLNLLRNGMYGEAFDLMEKRNKLITETQNILEQGEYFNIRREWATGVQAEIDKRFDPKGKDTYQLNILARKMLEEEARAKTDEGRVFWQAQRKYIMENGVPMPTEEQTQLWDDLKYHTGAKSELLGQGIAGKKMLQDARQEWKSLENSLNREHRSELEAKKAEYKEASDERRAEMRAHEFELSADLKKYLQEKGLAAKETAMYYVQGKLDERQGARIAAGAENLDKKIAADIEKRAKDAELKRELQAQKAEDRMALENFREGNVERRFQQKEAGKKEELDKRLEAMAKRGRNGNPTLRDVDADMLAKRYLATGDQTLLAHLGFNSPNYAFVMGKITDEMEKQNITPEMLGQRKVTWEARKVAARVGATQETRMGIAGIEMVQTLPLLKAAIKEVPRTEFLPFNKLIEFSQKQTLSPAQVKLMSAIQSTVNAYASIMNRGASITTDTSRNRAHELLDSAWDEEAVLAAVDQMQAEAKAAVKAPELFGKMMEERYGGGATMKVEEEIFGKGAAKRFDREFTDVDGQRYGVIGSDVYGPLK